MLYFSGKGSGLMEPSRCLSRICTLLSALSSSCLHCAERRMPSSNILIESSSGRSPRSNWATMPSSCLSDSSNVAHAVPLRLSGLYALAWPRPGRFLALHNLKNLYRARITPEGRTDLHTLDHRVHRRQHFPRDANAFRASQIRSVGPLHA